MICLSIYTEFLQDYLIVSDCLRADKETQLNILALFLNPEILNIFFSSTFPMLQKRGFVHNYYSIQMPEEK